MRCRGRVRILVGLIGLAVAYCGLLARFSTLTGVPKIDGGIGVLLGLYICSHPAANLLDLLLFGRRDWLQGLSGRMLGLWLGLNGLVLACGWFVLLVGTIRFTAG